MLDSILKFIIAPIVIEVVGSLFHKRTVDDDFRRKSDETFAQWAQAKNGDDAQRKAAAQALYRLLSS